MAIKNIIFDLGGVWLPIDERRTLAAFAALAGAGSQEAADLAARLQPDILAYELGDIDDRTLLGRLGRALRRAPDPPPTSDQALTDAWNAMLLPFPEAHLPLLDAFGDGYRIFLLSNTNALHIRCVEQDFQRRFPDRKPFLQHFEKAYLSHELHLRKPQPEIYTRVLQDAQLCAGETLFVDDRAENIAAAAAHGLHTRLHPANAPLTELPL
ncbi:MAG: HAD-IA family hydrolase [Bacteroidales bacterium]|nr:HAD-IA family hydrolase [Bacteroidales bacterium]